MGEHRLNGTSAAAVTVLAELTHVYAGCCFLIQRAVRGQSISAVCVHNQMSVHQADNSKSKLSKPGAWQDPRVVPLATERSEDKQAGSHMTSFYLADENRTTKIKKCSFITQQLQHHQKPPLSILTMKKVTPNNTVRANNYFTQHRSFQYWAIQLFPLVNWSNKIKINK